MEHSSLITYVVSFTLGVLGAGVFFAAVVISGLRSSPKPSPPPAGLKELTGLLPDEWELVSWNPQCMGWVGKFVIRGRRIDVSSHRGYVEVYEIISRNQRQIPSPEGLKTPKQVYEFLTKTVV
jgi:hypothetical protein